MTANKNLLASNRESFSYDFGKLTIELTPQIKYVSKQVLYCALKASWLAQSAALTNTTAASGQTTSGHNSGDQPEDGINGYGGKNFEKRKVLRLEWKMWKMPRERLTSGPGSQYGDGEELGDDERSN